MPSSTEENYLKAIFRHSRGDGPDRPVNLGRIAQDLAVTPGTVTQMMKHLAQRDLVVYRSRRGVNLTEKGERTALDILRRHRLIELFLVEVMGMDWADVHGEAEELEHVVSERLVARMDEMLGHPSHDPHGAPIPDVDGVEATHDAELLAHCSPGRFRLVQVDEGSSEFLGWLARHALTPGTEFVLESCDSLAGTMTLCAARCAAPVSISNQAARMLMVVPAED